MPDFLARATQPLPVGAIDVLVRLVLSMLFGGLVTLIYRATRPADEVAPSFTVTLVLLCILIALVTQVIGDNVARAFSLVGALSIVRFRTVVRDTQDTAFVIFAVAVGMASGPAAGLELVDALTSEPSLASYHLLPAVRGDLLAKLGRSAEARREFERAASLTRNEREREVLLGRAAEAGRANA